MVIEACRLYDNEKKCGEEANLSKLLAAEASWNAAEAAMQTFGGFAFSEEYDVERKFRETRLYQTAPVSTNMILAYISHKVLGMPRTISLILFLATISFISLIAFSLFVYSMIE